MSSVSPSRFTNLLNYFFILQGRVHERSGEWPKCSLSRGVSGWNKCSPETHGGHGPNALSSLEVGKLCWQWSQGFRGFQVLLSVLPELEFWGLAVNHYACDCLAFGGTGGPLGCMSGTALLKIQRTSVALPAALLRLSDTSWLLRDWFVSFS